MKTKVIRMNPQELDMEGIREAGEILKQGGLVAFPTSGENCKRGAGECKKTGINLLAGTIDNDFSEKRYCAL